MIDQSFFITLLTIELMIPHAQSLKDRRSEVRGLKERICSKFNASVDLDKWQRVCLVGSDKGHLESNNARIRTLCAEAAGVEVTSIDQDINDTAATGNLSRR